MGRITVLAYGIVSYLIFFGTFLYSIGFLGNFGVPKTIDSPRNGDLTTAILVDAGLLALFAIQHSVMARPAFKRWWTRFVPRTIERSTYVLFSSVAMIALFVGWRPLGGELWSVENETVRAAIHAVYGLGWLMLLYATMLLNHFDLFGVRQVYLHFRGREYTPIRFGTPGAYRFMRHPIYVAWMTIFWATPTMTVTHLVFAIATTAYILVAIRLEERDLVAEHGEHYLSYREKVRAFVPVPRRGAATERAAA
jgi:protein-S-isoprenylcysteine O-methyltransferase Ste14